MSNSKTVNPLIGWQRLCYCAALVNQMAINFRLFAELTDPRMADTFEAILALVYEQAAGTAGPIDFDKQLDKLEAITPDPEEHDIYGAYPALDACVALAALLSACGDDDDSELDEIEAISDATATGYLALLEPEHPDRHSLPDDNATLRQALRDTLAAGADRRQAVRECRELVASHAVSNIGLALS